MCGISSGAACWPHRDPMLKTPTHRSRVTDVSGCLFGFVSADSAWCEPLIPSAAGDRRPVGRREVNRQMPQKGNAARVSVTGFARIRTSWSRDRSRDGLVGFDYVQASDENDQPEQ